MPYRGRLKVEHLGSQHSSEGLVDIMPSLIELDATVADLYRRLGIEGPFITTTHCAFAQMDLHPNWPREKVFPEDEEPVPYSADERERDRLRKVILGLKPVRRAFAVGDMDVIMLLSASASKENAELVFAQLIPEQRPRPKYIELDRISVHEQLSELSRGEKLVYWRP